MFNANAAENYYESITNQKGFELKSALKKLLARTHRPQGYKALYRVYITSDIDTTYDNDGSIVDMYSENPKGVDPYIFKTERQRCGQYSKEADCYNREHIFPQSSFKKKPPMRSDFFHVYPTDGYVNNRRGHFPFGEVDGIPSYTSQNGSKVGYNTFESQGSKVFEPINEFKGDIARALFYFATRYENRIQEFHHDWLDGSRSRVYKPWFTRLLLKWHRQDPVSVHEQNRNNAGFSFQENRNPFIDHPEYVESIWANSIPLPSTP